MPVTVIQDLRYGDTGKGKLSGRLSHPNRCDISVRSLGGANAGHVIVKDTRKIALHLLPAGCVHEGVDLVLGRGMATHLPTLLNEIDTVEKTFATNPLSRLRIAKECHILFEEHKVADGVLEKRKGNNAIGTTKSGIGPAYADKALRVSLRMESLRLPKPQLKDAYLELASHHWRQRYGPVFSFDLRDQQVADLLRAKEMLEPCIIDNMRRYWAKNIQKRIVVEGAQGTELGINAPGYPYVTSSSTTVNGHMDGAGLQWDQLKEVIGTLKIYDTRVGNGDLKTELSIDAAAKLRELGGERGSTTGRNRRIGWLNLEELKDVIDEERPTKLAVLKGDVLDSYEVIPFGLGCLPDGRMDYATLPGWTPDSIKGLRDEEALPQNAKNVYDFIANHTGVPVGYIGTGPENDDLIEVKR